MSSKYNFVKQYKVKMKTFGPLHTENEDNALFISQDDGMPMIGATSIAGAFKAYLDEESDGVKSLFGSGGEESKKSKVVFTDAIGDKRNISFRPHICIDRRTGTAKSSNNRGQFFRREYIEKDTEFEFDIRLYLNDVVDSGVDGLIEKCIKAIDEGVIKLGGLKNSGAGRFKMVSVKKTENMLKNRGFIEYLKNDNKNEREILEDIKGISLSDNFVKISMSFATESPLIIKGLLEAEKSLDANKKLPDSMAMKNGVGNYIIPGSSLKGVFRSHCTKIASFLGKDNQLITDMFGSDKRDKKDKNKELVCGKCSFSDVILENVNDEVEYTRIKIDKFTGGASGTALLTEKPVVADGRFDIVLKKGKYCKEQVEILLLALRDFAVGDVALGSHQGIGRGIIEGKKLMVDDKLVIELKNINDEQTKKVKEYMDGLVEVKKYEKN